MGNLLGAPVTDKETHEGASEDGSLQFAVSSMQGWRVHMEDAHILEPRLYAAVVADPSNSTASSEPSVSVAPPSTPLLSPPAAANEQHNDASPGVSPTSFVNQVTTATSTTASVLDLPGHALFAVFDGHGGTFAAAYAGRNLCRVLSRQPKFALYAEFERSRPQEEKVLTTATDRAKFFRTGLALLEASLCDAFVDLDREIAQALKGVKVPEADKPYHPPPLGNHRRPTSTLMVPSNQHCEDVRILTTTATGASMVVEEEGSSCSTALPDGTTATPSTGASSLTVQRNVADGSGFGNHPDDEDDDEDDPSASPSDSALQLLEEEGDSGTTACVVIVTPHYVLCANAGDSRAVISRLGHRAVPLSYDHKPDDEGEERRIRAAGGYVAGGRVEGDLAVSRGLGDFRFKNMNTVMAATSAYRYGESDTAGATASSTSKPSSPASFPGSVLFPQGGSSQQQQLMKPGDQKVSPIPDVVIQARNPGQDEFILVACDGIWDVLTNYEAVQTIAELFKEGETNLGLICEELCDLCLSMGSKDNMTALVVKFPAQTSGPGGGVLARRQLRDEAVQSSNSSSGGGTYGSNAVS